MCLTYVIRTFPTGVYSPYACILVGTCRCAHGSWENMNRAKKSLTGYCGRTFEMHGIKTSYGTNAMHSKRIKC